MKLFFRVAKPCLAGDGTRKIGILRFPVPMILQIAGKYRPLRILIADHTGLHHGRATHRGVVIVADIRQPGSSQVTRKRILILGGTEDARLLAATLSQKNDCDVVLSLAGRTVDPVAQLVPVRSGGFGGCAGLAAYLRTERIDLLIDATHPFAEQISIHANAAARDADVSMLTLCRPAWDKTPGDIWTGVESIAEAVAHLGLAGRRVFLAIGRQQAFHFATAPQHSYLIRSIEPIEPPLDLPDAHYVLDAGPFSQERELELLLRYRIDVIVSKNSGGSASYGKIAAARELCIEVVMIGRKPTTGAVVATTIDQALQMARTLLALPAV